MEYKEALDAMCRRCRNYAMCQGTGCHPKKVLAELIEKQTPKKPNGVYDDEPLCPHCQEVIEDGDAMCEACHQLIDWRG